MWYSGVVAEFNKGYKNIYIYFIWWSGEEDELSIEESHSLRREAGPQSGGTAVDMSLSRWQQGRRAVAGSDVVFLYALFDSWWLFYDFLKDLMAK